MSLVPTSAGAQLGSPARKGCCACDCWQTLLVRVGHRLGAVAWITDRPTKLRCWLDTLHFFTYVEFQIGISSLKKWYLTIPSYKYLFKKRILNLFLEGKEEREGEKHQCVVASHVPPTRDMACNPGTCPDWNLNQQPFGSQARAQSTEPHQPGSRAQV